MCYFAKNYFALKIIFLGTPDFAVESLKAIVDAGFNVVAVVTAPDKPAGRGMHLQQSPVKKIAIEKNIPVLQPVKLKDENFIAELKSYEADLQVVIAFRMLPLAVWNMPKLGTINLHASLLPDYRGAAPINRAIMNGEMETGVCTFFLKHEIDTGDLVMQKKIPIGKYMNAGELHDILMNTGAELIVETLRKIESGSYQTIPQGNNSNKFAPKIFTADCKINWNDKGETIYNTIRGLSPYPAAFTELDGKILKIYNADFIHTSDHKEQIGNYITDGKTYLHFVCANGIIDLKEIQLAGKKRMMVEEMLRGYRKEN